MHSVQSVRHRYCDSSTVAIIQYRLDVFVHTQYTYACHVFYIYLQCRGSVILSTLRPLALYSHPLYKIHSEEEHRALKKKAAEAKAADAQKEVDAVSASKCSVNFCSQGEGLLGAIASDFKNVPCAETSRVACIQ